MLERKLVSFSQEPIKERYEFLTEYAKKFELDLQFSYVNPSVEEFKAELEKSYESYHHIIIESPYGELAVETQDLIPNLISRVGSADRFIPIEKSWYARNYLYDAIKSILARKKITINFGSLAMLIGCGAAARSCVFVLSQMGFRRVTISDQYPEKAQKLIENLKKQFLGMEFEFVHHEKLTLLPGVHSILINGTPYSKSNEILEDIQYLNFLENQATVVDLTMVPVKTPLIEEAEEIGLSPILGCEVASLVDIQVLSGFLNKPLDPKPYTQGLKEVLEKIPVEDNSQNKETTPYISEAPDDTGFQQPPLEDHSDVEPDPTPENGETTEKPVESNS